MATHDHPPEYAVAEAEYLRLLGYPPGHQPGERVRELMAWARDWYARHGRPWVHVRRVSLQSDAATLQLDGVEFRSARLREHLRHHQATGALLLAVSAGPEAETHAGQLWTEGRPDEYFFLEMYASAVVEDLVARANGRSCDEAGAGGLHAVPHYSPGYTGWDVAEQPTLFELMRRGLDRPLPGPLEVLPSGMLRPKKSLLAVLGLAPASAVAAAATVPPCAGCAFAPCAYRRAPYRHAAAAGGPPAAPAPAPARYTVNARALRKWADERVRLAWQPDGSVEAVFRFDGTTCAHRPLAFDYQVRLSGPDAGHRILAGRCTPAPDDEGHQYTCSYLSDGADHLREIAADQPLVGRPLDEVLAWTREPAPAGCHCAPASRTHKWGLALEAIHYALARVRPAQPVS